MMNNQKYLADEATIRAKLIDIDIDIDKVMISHIDRGMSTKGGLPSGLKVNRRAPALHSSLSVEISSIP